MAINPAWPREKIPAMPFISVSVVAKITFIAIRFSISMTYSLALFFAKNNRNHIPRTRKRVRKN